MLAIHRKQRDVMLRYGSHHHFTGGHQHFLVRQSDVLTLLNRLVSRRQAHNTHRRGYHRIGIRMRGDPLDSLSAEEYFDRFDLGRWIDHTGAQIARRCFGCDRNDLRAVPQNLLGNQRNV